MLVFWPRKSVSATLLFLTLIASSQLGLIDLARAKACATKSAEEVEQAVSQIKSWKELHAYYKVFGKCDDGDRPGLVSGAVINLMTVHWNDLQSGAIQIINDPQFSDFVLSHINSTVDADDLRRIAGNASKKCPMTLILLCMEIKQVAKAATQ